MALENVERGPVEKEIVESAGKSPQRGHSDQNVESGQEAVDLDRIQMVYRYG